MERIATASFAGFDEKLPYPADPDIGVLQKLLIQIFFVLFVPSWCTPGCSLAKKRAPESAR
jgi:hypothetical protein